MTDAQPATIKSRIFLFALMLCLRPLVRTAIGRSGPDLYDPRSDSTFPGRLGRGTSGEHFAENAICSGLPVSCERRG